MPRIEAKKAGGAYPLPPEWRKYIWRLFSPFEAAKGKRAIILDPFANEGDTAMEIAAHLNLDPYLVEVQQKFADAGRDKLAKFYQDRGSPDYSLTRFLYGDSYRIEMSNGAASIVYCNPPFDEQIITNVDQHTPTGSAFGSYGAIRSERYELTCIKQFFKYVAPNGFFVWIGYSSHMTKKVFRAFSDNCDNLLVFRFPEPHLDHYTLVCIVANYIKGHEKTKDQQKLADKEAWFVDLGQHPEKILSFDKVYDVLEKKNAHLFPGIVSGTQYPGIPPLNIYRGAVYFQPQRVDPTAQDKLNVKHGAHNNRHFLELCKPTEEPPLDKPLHRPNKRQMVVNIASGMLDNIELVRDGKRALLRGSVRELYQRLGEEREQVQDKQGSFTRVYTTTMIRPDHHIALLYEDGKIEDISGPDALKEIVEANSELLIGSFSKRFTPFYDMQIDPVWNRVLSEVKFAGKGNFFKPQKYVTACTIEHLAIRNKQITNAVQGSGKTGFSGATMICLRILHLALHHKAGAPLPKIVKFFGIKQAEFEGLVGRICQRYGVKPDELTGVPVDMPCIVSVPAIAPSIWMQQEIQPMYKGFVVRQLFAPTDADEFMQQALANEDDTLIYLGVVSYENAKANEGREPAAVKHYDRYFGWESDENRSPIKVIKVTIKPTDPITGEVILNPKGEVIPWMRFTPEKRGKQLMFYVGKEFYGYKSTVVQLPDGKKEVKLQKNDNGKLYSHIVTRKLGRDDHAMNEQMGYPYIVSRQSPLFSEIRDPRSAPKVGNGRVVTPVIEKTALPKTIKQIRFHDSNGYRCKPYIADVLVRAHSIQVYDFEHQRNLTGEPILDPVIANLGKRYIDKGGKRKDSIDKLMNKLGLSHYRVGGGHTLLDEALRALGLFQYEVGVGKIAPRNPRYPLANYFRRFYQGKIGLYIADELHVAKSANTEVAASVRDTAMTANMVIGLTGTLYGGKSSSVYALAYAFDETVRKRYPWQRGTPLKWIEDMGVRKMVETRDVGGGNAALRSGRAAAPRISEAPGASPMLMRLLAKFTLWFSLADLGDKMPDKEELSYEVKFDKIEQEVVDDAWEETRRYNATRIIAGDKSYLAELYQTNLCIGDALHRENLSIHNIKGDKGAARAKYAEVEPVTVCVVPSLGPDLHSKERQVLEWLAFDLAAGRRVIVSMCQTGTRDIQDRWQEIIEANIPAAKPFILRSSVKASTRSDYIKKQVAGDYNVMITNGGLITTAISINNFSAWHSIEYSASLYTFSQSTARINRPSQESDDIIYRHFYFDDHFQKRAIMNIADKVKSAAVLQGAEGGSLEAMMSSEDRVVSYESILNAIENGQAKLKSAKEISAAFQAATVNSTNWSDSAWMQPGDEMEQGEFYEEEVIEVEEETEAEGESSE